MDQLPPLGTEINDVVGPTLQKYEPLLLRNAETIRSVKKQTVSYGPTDRQKLDVYQSAQPGVVNGRKPVLMFLYGGGFVRGERTLAGYAEDLCHSNIAAFFALRCGYQVVIPDYRLVGSHDAKFPSGGEDVGLAIEWVSKNSSVFGSDQIDLFVMGNSVGGVHLSTFLLHSSFLERRSKVLSGDGLRLRGAVLLSVPFHFKLSYTGRAEALNSYYGDHHEENSPLGLLKSAKANGALDVLQSDLRLLALNCELDPEDEILKPRDDFILEWLQLGGNQGRMALAVDSARGHNHISPFCSLGTSVEREEAWGFQVAAFCDSIRKSAPA